MRIRNRLPLLALLLITSGGASALGATLPSSVLPNLEAASVLGLRGLPHLAAPGYTSIEPLPPGHSSTLVRYVGAEFCPYCAGLRWPLTIALMRFGTFTGLAPTRSSSHDVFPSTATLTYVHATYKSRWLTFAPVEVANRYGKPLQPLKGAARKAVIRFDAAPYTANPGSIPFLTLGGRWLSIGSPVSVRLFAGLSQAEIAKALANPKSALARDVLPQANLLTAALCEATGEKPAHVCEAKGVVAAAGQLP